LVFYVLIYAVAAIVREGITVLYYRAIFERRAGLASILSGLIELIDLTVLSSLVLWLVNSRGINKAIPAVAYAVFGSLGVYLGVKYRNKNKGKPS